MVYWILFEENSLLMDNNTFVVYLYIFDYHKFLTFQYSDEFLRETSYLDFPNFTPLKTVRSQSIIKFQL